MGPLLHHRQRHGDQFRQARLSQEGSMATLVSQDYRVSEHTAGAQHPGLSKDLMEELRSGLATCRSMHGLTPEARQAIVNLCDGARRDSWTPEQLVVAVKDACYSSTEIAHLTTTSERDAFLARIVTECIQEFFRQGRAV